MKHAVAICIGLWMSVCSFIKGILHFDLLLLKVLFDDLFPSLGDWRQRLATATVVRLACTAGAEKVLLPCSP
jgi:hypothetical protein